MLAQLSRLEICQAMAVQCQKSADHVPAAQNRIWMQQAADKFREEAQELTIEADELRDMEALIGAFSRPGHLDAGEPVVLTN